MKQILHNLAATSMTVKRNLLSSVFILVFLSAGLSSAYQHYSKLVESATDSSININ